MGEVTASSVKQAIGTLVVALIGLLVAFGVNLDDTQVAAILVFEGAVVSAAFIAIALVHKSRLQARSHK